MVMSPAIEVEPVPSDTAGGCAVLPRRWSGVRVFARIGPCRRLARDRAHGIESPAAWAVVATIRRMTRSVAGDRCPMRASEPGSETGIAQAGALMRGHFSHAR